MSSPIATNSPATAAAPDISRFPELKASINRKLSISSQTTADGSCAKSGTSMFSMTPVSRPQAHRLSFDTGALTPTPQVKVVWPRSQKHRSVSEVTESPEKVGRKTSCAEKIFDEAHHFGLCEHYARLLDQAKALGFENVNWPTGFTLFHLAAKKGNGAFIDWLCSNDCNDIHAIDDFGKKPIDYVCRHTSADNVREQLEHMMTLVNAPDSEAEKKYQAIKNGTWVPEVKEKKKKQDMSNVIDFSQVAVGDIGPEKPADLMSAHEAELVVPPEYKKSIKVIASGGWDNMAGKWPQDHNILCWAAKAGKEELCKFLVIECNAPPAEEDGNGRNALYYAKLKKHRDLYKAMLAKFKDTGKTTKKGKKK